MKKFVNDPRQFVPEMLKGIALANPETLRYVPEYNLIMRTDAPRDDKVSVIQGSGSGHEPAHVMIVGKGMLDAACPGDVFAAPPMDYVLETSKLLNSPKGVLHIINNYTGDRMAFEMGQEMAEADGITIGTLLVDDDVDVVELLAEAAVAQAENSEVLPLGSVAVAVIDSAAADAGRVTENDALPCASVVRFCVLLAR
jgi:dihydroxyacetone kinase-like protein